jgi:D-alanine transaminase
MSRIAYVNGRYVPAAHAMVAMEDRGYQFADGIYEAIAALNGKLVDGEWHFDRLERSLRELAIPLPMARTSLKAAIRELMRRNRRDRGVIYIQVTRGAARRNHIYGDDLQPVVTMSFLPPKFRTKAEREKGVSVISRPDQRWARCDIKTIALLPNMLARVESYRAGAKETWLLRDGVITEGSLSNVYIVDDKGTIITHPADTRILGGVRRKRTLELARELQIKVEERPFTLDEALKAKEAFISSCSSFITPVVTLDAKAIGDGVPGPVTRRLMDVFDGIVEEQTGWKL